MNEDVSIRRAHLTLLGQFLAFIYLFSCLFIPRLVCMFSHLRRLVVLSGTPVITVFLHLLTFSWFYLFVYLLIHQVLFTYLFYSTIFFRLVVCCQRFNDDNGFLVFVDVLMLLFAYLYIRGVFFSKLTCTKFPVLTFYSSQFCASLLCVAMNIKKNVFLG